MRSLLVLAQHPDLTEHIRAGLDPEQYRVLERNSLDDAEPLLAHGVVDACIFEADLSTVQGVWFLEKLHRRAPGCPIIIYTTSKLGEGEEEAYLQGATHVLTKPVRPRLLSALLDRLWASPPAPLPGPPPSPMLQEISRAVEAAPPSHAEAAHTLGVLRDFSGILTHSLNAEGMVKQFLLLLREILSINRAAIFLRQPCAGFSSPQVGEASRQLRAVCAVGLAPSLLQHFELTFATGIGAHLFRLGRILRRSSDEARNDLAAQKEFELLGAQVAVPILDRETVLGVAVFDGRITGEPLVNAELELVFHLLEQLGLAVKNIWLHDQLASNHAMMADILRELSSACVVVNRDLAILHANKMARRWFGRTDKKTGELEFSDLPQVLGAKIYQVLKTGAAVSSFRFNPDRETGTVYNINVVPFQRQQPGLIGSALLMAEDLTQTEQFQRLEVETAKLRLIKLLADRLTHEIGNAMVPLSVHQQMLAEKLDQDRVEPGFLRAMDADLADGVKRVSRLLNQMRFLARDAVVAQEAFPLAPLLEDAYQEARRHLPGKAAQLMYETGNRPIILNGERAALKHALAEVMLNALQANPADPKVSVRLRGESNGNGLALGLQIEVLDNGPGFTSEALQKAASPFFTTRSVGLGLGLTVSRKIIETHNGKLEIVPPQSGGPQYGLVRISLPLETTSASLA
jgi:signal transduction histidine kinase/DNA-binding NarL/FixJ family response regulator